MRFAPAAVGGLLLLLAPAAGAAAPPGFRTFTGGVTDVETLAAPEPVGPGALLTAHSAGPRDRAAELRTLDGSAARRLPLPEGAGGTYAAPRRGGYVVATGSTVRMLDARLRDVGIPTRLRIGSAVVVGLAAAGDRVAVLVRASAGTAARTYRVAGTRLTETGRTPYLGDEDAGPAQRVTLDARGAGLLVGRDDGTFDVARLDRAGRLRARRRVKAPAAFGDDALEDVAVAPDGRAALTYADGQGVRVVLDTPGRAPRVAGPPTAVTDGAQVALRAARDGVRMSVLPAAGTRATVASITWAGRAASAGVPLAGAHARALAAATATAPAGTSAAPSFSSVAEPVGSGLRVWIALRREGWTRYFAYAVGRDGAVGSGGEVPAATGPSLSVSPLPGPGGPLVAVRPAGGITPRYVTTPDAPEGGAPAYGSDVAAMSVGARRADGSVLLAAAGSPQTLRLLPDGSVTPGPTLPFVPDTLVPAPDGGVWAVRSAGIREVARVAPDGGVGAVVRPATEQAYSAPAGVVALRDGSLLTARQALGPYPSCPDPSGRYCIGDQPPPLNRTCFGVVRVDGTSTTGGCVETSGALVAHADGALVLGDGGRQTTAIAPDGTLDPFWGSGGTAPTGRTTQAFASRAAATADGGFSVLAPTGQHTVLLLRFGPDGRQRSEKLAPLPAGASVALFSPEDGAIASRQNGPGVVQVGRLFTVAEVAGA